MSLKGSTPPHETYVDAARKYDYWCVLYLLTELGYEILASVDP